MDKVDIQSDMFISGITLRFSSTEGNDYGEHDLLQMLEENTASTYFTLAD